MAEYLITCPACDYSDKWTISDHGAVKCASCGYAVDLDYMRDRQDW